MSKQWFYMLDDEERGPVSNSDLKALILDEKFSREALIKKVHWDNWLPVSDIEPLLTPEGYVQDCIDGTLRHNTPEEQVRQATIRRLVNELGYPKQLIKVEHGIQIGSGRPRADIVVFFHHSQEYSQENIRIIIECKSEAISPNRARIEQLKSYMSACPNCEWGMWTNGAHKEVLRKVTDTYGLIQFAPYRDLPFAEGPLAAHIQQDALEDNSDREPANIPSRKEVAQGWRIILTVLFAGFTAFGIPKLADSFLTGLKMVGWTFVVILVIATALAIWEAGGEK